MTTKSIATNWRAYTARERKRIEARLNREDGSRCPRCDDFLEARPDVPVLQCRECRRFHTRVEPVAEYLYILRMQRLATAILQA